MAIRETVKRGSVQPVRVVNAVQTVVDSNNSSINTLGGGGGFIGAATDVTGYSSIAVNVYSNVASATDGLSLQQSSNGTNWDHLDQFTIPSGGSKVFTLAPHCQFFRIVYTNGGTGQLAFRLQTILKGYEMTPSTHRIQDSISDDDDAQLIKAVLTGQANGTFENVKTTADGDLKISDNSSGLAIAEGNVTGATFIHKFGEAPDFDSGDGEVTLWDGADDGLLGGGAMSYTYSSSADIDTISSSAADTVDIEVQGLDASYDLVVQTKTLTGTTDAILDTPLIRVFRMKNVGATNLAGTVYLRTNGSGQSAGVPSTANTVRSIISIGNNQTLMAVYTIPNGSTGYMRDWYAATAGANRTTNYKIRLKARPFGQVFQLKHSSAIAENGTSQTQHIYEEPEVFATKTDIEMTVATSASPITAADVSGGFDIVLMEN